jgi:hypothetical protein
MSENPSTLTSIDAYDLFVDVQFLASHPKNTFTLAWAKRLTDEEGVELRPTSDPTVVVFSEFEHPSVLAGPRRRPRTALWAPANMCCLVTMSACLALSREANLQ